MCGGWYTTGVLHWQARRRSVGYRSWNNGGSVMVLEMTPTIDEAAVQAFQAGFRGALIRPGDDGYDTARAVYNGMIDRRPALIARCADVAIRGGGHNGPGLGTCDDGLVIDLGAMRGVRVDPAESTVRVEGGATWGD